jgi:hypothetical protein
MVLSLLFIASLVVSATTASARNSSALLFLLANPTADLGFEDNAAGVSLPDTDAILDEFTPTEQEEIVQMTIAGIDRVYSGLPIATTSPPTTSGQNERDD